MGCTFWLRNVLRATTACTFSTSQLPKLRCLLCTFWLGNVLRATTACNFSSLIWPAGSAPAALASLLFDPPEPHIIGKTQCFATFLPFRASASSFFRLFPFSDLLSSTLLLSLPLPSSAFHLSILSEVWLLNFLRWITVIYSCLGGQSSGVWKTIRTMGLIDYDVMGVNTCFLSIISVMMPIMRGTGWNLFFLPGY